MEIHRFNYPFQTTKFNCIQKDFDCHTALFLFCRLFLDLFYLRISINAVG